MSVLNSVEKKYRFQLLLRLLMVGYLFISFRQVYYIKEQGLRAIGWLTSAWFVTFIFFILALLEEFLFMVIKERKTLQSQIRYSLFLLFIFCFALENGLRFLNINNVYSETRGSYYSSPYSPQDQTWFHHWRPLIPHHLKTPEYDFIRQTNSFGFADSEPDSNKKEGEIRLLTLGDSFTEGDGAPFDSSYPNQLRMLLAADTFKHYSLINAGMCGSDPFFNFMDLKCRLLPYKPDVVIMTLCSDDLLTDIITRGGFERFKADSTLEFRKAPSWEWLFAISHISRIYFRTIKHYDLLLLRPEDYQTQKAFLDSVTIHLMSEINTLAAKNNFKVLLLFFPTTTESYDGRYKYDFSILKNGLTPFPNISPYFLLDFYIKEGVNKNNLENYYWAQDGHHKSRGYNLMARGVLKALREKGLL